MFNKFKKSELLILALAIIIIFVAEYYFIVLDNPIKAIFIGLWPPTMLTLLIYMELKRKK
jgi:hypothetical protein